VNRETVVTQEILRTDRGSGGWGVIDAKSDTHENAVVRPTIAHAHLHARPPLKAREYKTLYIKVHTKMRRRRRMPTHRPRAKTFRQISLLDALHRSILAKWRHSSDKVRQKDNKVAI
jgi:hypothetical protein